MRYGYHTLDVFTDRVFGGNPLAVFPHADGIPGGVMASIARELNLSETVFVLRPASADGTRRLRIFTPGAELPFAGHPTLGTAHLLAALGEPGLEAADDALAQVLFEEGIGPVRVTIRREAGMPVFTQLTAAQAPEMGPRPPSRERLARLLGLEVGDVLAGDWSPAAVSCGVPFLFVPLASRSAVARARMDHGVWANELKSYWAPQVFVFAREAEMPGSDIRARMFAPGLGVPEDPATGSAVAALGGYLAGRPGQRDGLLQRTIEQGFEMGRPSLLYLEADVTNGRADAVRVGGRSVLVGQGEIDIPDDLLGGAG